MCIFFIAFFKGKIPFRYWRFGPVILIAIFALMVTFGKPVLDRLTLGDEGATSSRKRAIVLALDLIKRHPILGVGPWNFARGSLDEFPPTKLNQKPENEMTIMYGRLEVVHIEIGPRIYTLPLPVHNKFLLIFSELGIIGLILFFWFQFSVFNHIRKSLKSTDEMLQWCAMGIMAAFFATISYMNLDLFSDDKTTQILLIVPVLAMIVHNLERSGRKANRT
jgi:O-antigen ligase